MPLNARGVLVPLKVGQVTTVDGQWYRIHAISRKKLVMMRLSKAKARQAQSVLERSVIEIKTVEPVDQTPEGEVTDGP